MPPASRKRRPARAGSTASRGGAPGADAPTARPRGEARDALLRAELAPLAPGEMPPALIVAIVVAVTLAAAVLIGALTIHDLTRRGGSLPGAIFLAAVLLAVAAGMARRRYWAVLAFEALLTFQVLVAALALVVASTVAAALLCLASIGLGGWLFWKLIRVMGRLQAPQRR